MFSIFYSKYTLLLSTYTVYKSNKYNPPLCPGTDVDLEAECDHETVSKYQKLSFTLFVPCIFHCSRYVSLLLEIHPLCINHLKIALNKCIIFCLNEVWSECGCPAGWGNYQAFHRKYFFQIFVICLEVLSIWNPLVRILRTV